MWFGAKVSKNQADAEMELPGFGVPESPTAEPTGAAAAAPLSVLALAEVTVDACISRRRVTRKPCRPRSWATPLVQYATMIVVALAARQSSERNSTAVRGHKQFRLNLSCAF